MSDVPKNSATEQSPMNTPTELSIIQDFINTMDQLNADTSNLSERLYTVVDRVNGHEEHAAEHNDTDSVMPGSLGELQQAMHRYQHLIQQLRNHTEYLERL